MRTLRIIITAILLCVAMQGMEAAYKIHSVTGKVLVTRHGKSVAATVGAAVSPGDMLEIPDGAVIEIVNDVNKTIYSSTSSGRMTVSRMMLNAVDRSGDTTGAVNSHLRFGDKGKGKGNRVYVETGMVKRSLAQYDPEASDVVIDPHTLAVRLCRMLTDGCGGVQPPVPVTCGNGDEGTTFSVDNTLTFPFYFNVIKLTGDGKERHAEISSLGQPSGSYVLLPRQSMTRSALDAIPEGERHYIVATHCHYDVDEVIASLNTMLAEGVSEPVLDIELYVMPVNTTAK